jgi:cell division protein FtsB
MKESTHDEYEDVESPFAPKSSRSSQQNRERLRTRKNVFNRPIATQSSRAPTFIEPPLRQASWTDDGDIDFSERLDTRRNGISQTEIDYLNEEAQDDNDDEVSSEIQPKPHRLTATRKKENKSKNLLVKSAWAVIGILVLRLIFMDRGVWDYLATERTIKNKKNELNSIHKENKNLRSEILKIQTDSGFQKQLAKEHLGVIALDEFLILFAGEKDDGVDSSNSL